jgi:hypothetical protein
MKKIIFYLIFLIVLNISWAAAPVVTNVHVQQRSGTKLVDINYTLALDSNVTATVGMWFSSDNGANYSIKLESVTGDVGSGIGSGDKSVVWDAGVDWDDRFTNDGKIRVIARNGDLEPDLNSTLGQGSNSVPIITWDKSFGSATGDTLSDMVVTEGGIYLLGRSDSNVSIDKSENSKGKYDYWIVKIDADGNKIWDKTIGTAADESLFPKITATSDGAIVIAGSSDSNASGDKSENSKGGSDYWILKIDADGNKIWDKTIGSAGNDSLTEITAAPDGAIVIAGISDSNASGDKSENSKGGSDYWILKIDADGNKIWDKTIGSVKGDSNPKITATSDGAIVIAGSSDSNASADKSENGKGKNDYWILKIDADGNKIWDKTIGSVGEDRTANIVATNEGTIVVGESNSNASGDKTEDGKGSNGDVDFWIVMLDSNGNKIWDKTIGTNSWDTNIFLTIFGAYGVGIDSLGNIFMYATSGSDPNGDKTSSTKGGSDYWVIKLSAK